MAELRVELYGHHVGDLVGTDSRTFDFSASRAALEHFSLDSSVLSVAVPLAAVGNRSRADRRRNFFAELLPEGDILESLARQAGRGTSTTDVIRLLAHFGRDVAGALQIWDPDRPGEPRTPELIPLDERGVAHLLRNAASIPLGNRPNGGKSSLAGVQEKIVLARSEGRWQQAIDGYPTTHILKPTSRYLPTVIFDEEYGARLARSAGLLRYDVHLDTFDGEHALIIERYDRSQASPVSRIHQEDMAQALGVPRTEKYQESGGRVSLARIARVFAAQGDEASVERLLVMVTVAVAVGNLDQHAKNVSILHLPDETMTLAPTYDMVPQAHQRNDGRLALSVGGEYVHARVTTDHLVREAEAWGVRDAATIVNRTLDQVAEAVAVEKPHAASYPDLATDIARFTRNLLRGSAVGE